ncbi:hypothetical protein MMPV_005767 [Pyropia vietnamensis]
MAAFAPPSGGLAQFLGGPAAATAAKTCSRRPGTTRRSEWVSPTGGPGRGAISLGGCQQWLPLRWVGSAGAPPSMAADPPGSSSRSSNEGGGGGDGDDGGGSSSSGGSSSLPVMYDAWFAPKGTPPVEGGELATRARRAIIRALDAGVTRMEVCFPCVPNVEELAYGTALNQAFGFQVADTLGMRDDGRSYRLVKTYLQSFANVYWVCALAPALLRQGGSDGSVGGGGGGDEGGGTVHALTTDSVVKERAAAAAAAASVRISSLRSRASLAVGPADAVVVVDPRATDTWRTAAAVVPPGDKTPLVALNASFTETYGLGGPLPDVFEPVFYLKRVSKGWILREYPGPWEVWLETPPTADLPSGSVELLSATAAKPRLGDVSKALRGVSLNRFGIFNDRWAKGFGGRL